MFKQQLTFKSFIFLAISFYIVALILHTNQLTEKNRVLTQLVENNKVTVITNVDDLPDIRDN